VTRTPYFQGQKVKSQDHQAALLSAALTRKAAAAVSVGTYSAWESTGEERGGGILCRQAHSLFVLQPLWSSNPVYSSTSLNSIFLWIFLCVLWPYTNY